MSFGQANPNVGLTPTSKVVTMFPGDYAAADEGSFFTSTLAATASTAVAITTQALADTNPALAIFNSSSVGGYNIYLRYIKYFITVVGGSNTTTRYSAIVDNVLAKLTTTGTALGTPVNVNTNYNNLSKLTGYGGVNIAAAAGAQWRRVGAGTVTGAVQTAFDEVIFDFGPPVYGKNGIAAAALSFRTVPMAPVVLAPGWWFTLGIWGASKAASADTIEWEIGWIERPTGQ
jgi:hypothetical protein